MAQLAKKENKALKEIMELLVCKVIPESLVHPAQSVLQGQPVLPAKKVKRYFLIICIYLV